jgi:2-keto-3-deoxy-L-rhamnonate aldolase RhmA
MATAHNKERFHFRYGSSPGSLQHKLKTGKTAWGTIVWDLPYPSTAEAIVEAGFDWGWIDMEHSPTSLERVTAFLRTSQPLGLTTLVRVPGAEYELIGRTLDCGASGIVVPRVSDRATAERVVSACCYPPAGRRGVGSHSMTCVVGGHLLSERLEKTNEEVMAVIQIETADALNKLEDIVSVPGIDAVILGPTDLTVSLGIAGEYEHPKIWNVLKRLVKLSGEYGFVAGCHYDAPELALKASRLGAKMVSTSNDIIMLKTGYSQVIKFLNG